MSRSIENNLLCSLERSNSLSLECIVSRENFKENWKKLTLDVFDSVEMKNLFIAGGSVLGCLIPNNNTLSRSDVDIFVYGVTVEEANNRILDVLKSVCENRKKIAMKLNKPLPTEIIAKSTHAITLMGCGIFRPIQFILRIYRSPSEVLQGFDIDSCCLGFDLSSETVFANPRGWRALVTRCNSIDTSRRSPSYESRLIKYTKRGFAIYVHDFKRSDIDILKLDIGLWAGLGQKGIMKLLQIDKLNEENVGIKVQRPIRDEGFSIRNGLIQPERSNCIIDKSMIKNNMIWDYTEEYGVKLGKPFHFVSNGIDTVYDSNSDDDEVIKRSEFKVISRSSVCYTQFLSIIELIFSMASTTWVTENPGQQGLLTSSYEPLDSSHEDFYQESLWKSGKSDPVSLSFLQSFYTSIRLREPELFLIEDSHVIDEIVLGDLVENDFVNENINFASSQWNQCHEVENKKLLKLDSTIITISGNDLLYSSLLLLKNNQVGLSKILTQYQQSLGLEKLSLTKQAQFMIQALLASMLSKIQYECIIFFLNRTLEKKIQHLDGINEDRGRISFNDVFDGAVVVLRHSQVGKELERSNEFRGNRRLNCFIGGFVTEILFPNT